MDFSLADSDEFRLRRLELEAGQHLSFGVNEEPRILSVVEGQLKESSGGLIGKGDNVLLPYASGSDWVAQGKAVVLVTDRFNQVR